MKWANWLDNWDMTSLKIKTSFLEMEWKPQDEDKAAAWELYVELLTRTATQPLDDHQGNEKAALDSIYSIFGVTRQVLKNNTRRCTEFTKIAVLVLNQVVRPFTSKWHYFALQGTLASEENRIQFRRELAQLQTELQKYARMLADMAGVEDLTTLQENDPSQLKSRARPK